MAIENARAKIAQVMAPLQLQELQQRIKQMQQPQAAGIVPTQNGGRGGVTFEPNTGTYSIQNLVPGAPPEPKFSSLQAAAAYYLQKGDLDKLKQVNDEIERTKTQKAPADPKDAFQLWLAQNPQGSVKDWMALQERYKKTGAEGGDKTPFELWKRDHPKGTYDEWLQASKQVDRGDAVKAVTAAMNAFKNLQGQKNTAQRVAGAWSVWKPGTWGSGDVSQATVQAAQQDYDAKRQDAIAKLTDAGIPIPAWLQDGSVSPVSTDLSDLGGKPVTVK